MVQSPFTGAKRYPGIETIGENIDRPEGHRSAWFVSLGRANVQTGPEREMHGDSPQMNPSIRNLWITIAEIPVEFVKSTL